MEKALGENKPDCPGQAQVDVVPRRGKQVEVNQVQHPWQSSAGRIAEGWKQTHTHLSLGPSTSSGILLEYTTLNVSFFLNVTIYRTLL